MKHCRSMLLVSGLILFTANVGSSAEVMTDNSRPRIGLTFAGGGAKGAAHIGVLKVLEEVGIPVDYVTGTSMGSIIGMLYSLGYSADEMEEIISGIDWNVYLSDRVERRYTNSIDAERQKTYLVNVPFSMKNAVSKRNVIDGGDDHAFLKSLPGGFTSGSNILNLFNSLSVGYQDSIDFNDLPIPYACVVSDVVSGQPKVLRSGRLPDAARASMAIPGLFAPVSYGENMKLVDGGLFNNFPVDVCRQMGADIVIGVEVTKNRGDVHSEDIQSLPELATRLFDMLTRKGTFENQQRCSIYIHPDISGFGTLSFTKENIKSIINRGYEAASEHRQLLDSLKTFLDSYPADNRKRSAPAKNLSPSSTTEVIVSSCNVDGLDDVVKNRMIVKSGVDFSKPVKGRDLDRLAEMISGLGSFKSINYYLHPQADGTYALEFKTIQAEPNSIAVGFRIDSQDAASALLHFGFGDNRLCGWKASTTWRVGRDIQGNFTFAYSPKILPTINLACNYRGNDIRMTLFGESLSYCIQRMYSVELYASQFHSRFIRVEGGLALENRSLKSLCYEDDFLEFLTKNLVKGSYQGYSELFGARENISANMPLSLFCRLKFDNFNKPYFPTRGIKLQLSADWYFAELNNLARKSGITNPEFGDLQLGFESCIPMGSSLVLKPQLYARALMGDGRDKVNYYIYRNRTGGSMAGRYNTQQLPFVGTNNIEYMSDLSVVGRADLQWNIAGSHYLTGIFNVSRDSDSLMHLFERDMHYQILGAGVEYAYNSIIGPVSLEMQWGNIQKTSFWNQLGLYLNVGYVF